MASCGCRRQTPTKPENPEEKKTYVCIQCNTLKSVPATEPVPECCGKKMSEMD